MIKLSYCLRRLPALSREAFQDYWLNRHAPLVKRHAAVLGIRRYSQVHALEEAVNGHVRAMRGGTEIYDGIAELWFESLEALNAERMTPEAQAASMALLEDERKFIDVDRSPIWVSVEHHIITE